MKRTILTILALFLVCGVGWAESAKVSCSKVFAGTLAASATVNPGYVVLGRNEGFTSVQAVFTGTGVLKIDYQLSNDGETWSPAVEIIASATSGTVYPYPAAGVNVFAGYQRLVLTETGTANPVVVTGVYRCIQ